MHSDPRVATRVKPRAGEEIEIQLMADGFLDIFHARDISVTGIGIFVTYRFEGCDLSQEFELVITLPSRTPFLARGRVIHRTRGEREFFGVEFVDLRPRHRQEIADYVARRSGDAAGCRSPVPKRER